MKPFYSLAYEAQVVSCVINGMDFDDISRMYPLSETEIWELVLSRYNDEVRTHFMESIWKITSNYLGIQEQYGVDIKGGITIYGMSNIGARTLVISHNADLLANIEAALNAWPEIK